jgi:glucose-1-phosphate thymidylyltransferase
MIHWPIMKLKEADIDDILIATNKDDAMNFITMIGNGEDYGINISYKIQDGAKGIADGVYLAKDFIQDESVVVILGDNIFSDSLKPYIQSFKQQQAGAKVLLKEVPDPERYGVAILNEKEKLIELIEEKPLAPKTNYCVIGVYMYDKQVFNFIERIEPSTRGELEITDVNNMYINKKD